VLAATAEDAVYELKQRFLYRGAAAFAKESIAALDASGRDISPTLLRSASERCEQIGEMKEAHSFIVQALESFNKVKKEGKDISDTSFAQALVTHGRLLVTEGSLKEALKTYKKSP
jgi:hypothetical protein